MPIYHVTYMSDGYKVKGYLGLPEGWSFPPQQVEDWIQAASATTVSLPARFLARLVNPNETSEVHQDAVPVAATEAEKLATQKLPGFIYCRGGIRKVGMVNPDWVAEFASYGYAVFAPSYRGNEGGEGRDEFGGADREDVHSAFRLLQKLPFVKQNEISVMGFSRGAVNAALSAVEVPGVQKLILWGGVADLRATYQERVDLRRMLRRVVGGTPGKVPEEYARRSPLNLASQIPCPVLIMHGTDDVQVDFSHGEQMFQRLSELGKRVSFHRFDNGGHHLPPPEHRIAVQNMFTWIRH